MHFRLSLIVLAAGALQLSAQAPAFDEYQVKAAFLYNFAKFVEWPPGTFANANDPIGICIIGQNPVGSTLEDMVQGKKIGDRAFVVRRLSGTQQVRNCQILFVAAVEPKRTRSLLEAFKGAGILTVGETDDFTAAGGIIGMKLEGTHIRLQIALETAGSTRLRISSKLLGLAEIVKIHK
jgi:YfiR/HmsC-like